MYRMASSHHSAILYSSHPPLWCLLLVFLQIKFPSLDNPVPLEILETWILKLERLHVIEPRHSTHRAAGKLGHIGLLLPLATSAPSSTYIYGRPGTGVGVLVGDWRGSG